MKKYALTFLIFIICGCSTSTNQPVNLTPPQDTIEIPTSTTQPTISPTNTYVPSPISTFTSTPLPTEAVTITPTLSPTLTPLPKISNEGELINLISFTNKKKCTLPCWAGITPGETTWRELTNIINQMESIRDIETNININNTPTEADNSIFAYVSGDYIRSTINISVHPVKDVITTKHVLLFVSPYSSEGSGFLLPDEFRLENVLQRYGYPSKVFLNANLITAEQSQVSLSILLVYPEHKFVINYHKIGTVRGDYLFACKPESYFTLIVVDKKEKLVSKQSIITSEEFRDLNIEGWFEFDEITMIPINEYFEDYLTSKNDCITLPIEVWLSRLAD